MGVYDEESVTMASQAAAIRKRQRNESQSFSRALELKSDIGKAISDPCRIRVIYLLIEYGELRVTDILEKNGFTETGQSALIHHLEKLLFYQIVTRKSDPANGRNRNYSLTPRGRRVAAILDSLT